MIWAKTYVCSTFNKKRIFQGQNNFWRDFALELVVVDLLIPILQCANAHLSNILRFWIKIYCWHFGSKVILAFYVAHFAI